MKPLTILLAMLVAVSMITFSAGSAKAVDNEWNALVACVTECKAQGCDVLLSHDRVICNHSCWCTCSGLCEGGNICLDNVLEEETRCEIAGGIAVPGEGFTLCTGVQKPVLDENLFPIDLTLPLTQPFKFYLKVNGNYAGMPAEEILCDIEPFTAFPDEGQVIGFLAASDADGCPIMEDTEGDDIAFLAVFIPEGGGLEHVELDPEEDEDDLYAEDFEDQVEACAERITGLELVHNSNACPQALKDLGGHCCTQEVSIVCDPLPCVYVYTCFDIENDNEVDCALCDLRGIYDTDDDYGLDACDEGDFFDTFGGAIPEPGIQTIFYANCPYEQLRNLPAAEKEWAITAALQLAPVVPRLVKNLVDDGKVMDRQWDPYEFGPSMNCMIDEVEGL